MERVSENGVCIINLNINSKIYTHNIFLKEDIIYLI